MYICVYIHNMCACIYVFSCINVYTCRHLMYLYIVYIHVYVHSGNSKVSNSKVTLQAHPPHTNTSSATTGYAQFEFDLR